MLQQNRFMLSQSLNKLSKDLIIAKDSHIAELILQEMRNIVYQLTVLRQEADNELVAEENLKEHGSA